MIRVGKISKVNKEKQTVQVLFEDMDKTTSDDLPLIYPHTMKNKVPKMPEINEEVLCLFLEGGSDGFCIGSFATDTTKPGTKEHFTFSDGTVLEYDTVTHHLKGDVKGTVTLKGESIILNGQTTLEGNVTLKGSITLEGDLTVQGSLSSQGQASLNGGATITGGTTISGGASIDGGATIGGATTLGDTTISGSVTFGGAVNCPDKCTCAK